MSYEVIEADQAEEMFRSMLDEVYPMVNACGYEYYPSRAIQELDPIVYRALMLDYYDLIYKEEKLAVTDYTDESIRFCQGCDIWTDDFRGDLCKDCDKQAQAGESDD
jgi:hypothetical protein